MPKISRARQGRWLQRIASCGRELSTGAKFVLTALVEHKVAQTEPPSQREWASHLGIGERALRDYLRELNIQGLVLSSPAGQGKPAVHHLAPEKLDAWASRSVVLEPVIVGEEAAKFAGLDRQNLPVSRARVNAGGGEEFPDPDGNDDLAGGRYEAVLARLKSEGVDMRAASSQEKLKMWLERSPLEDEVFHRAGAEAGQNATRAFRYVERILQRELREWLVSDGREPVDLEGYRSRWYETPAPVEEGDE